MRRLLLVALFLSAVAPGARAEVILTFYSHHLGTYGLDIAFPHAFILMRGTAGPNNKPVKANFGFTASIVGPLLLLGSVDGKLESMPDDYIAASKSHLSLAISDEKYRAVLAVVDHWRKYPQPSYNLDTHNCVTFVKEIAIALQLPASNDEKFVKDPQAFLEDLQLRTAVKTRSIEIARLKQHIRHPVPPAKNTVRPEMQFSQPVLSAAALAPNDSSKLNSTRATNNLTFVGGWSPVAGECSDNNERVPLKISHRRAEAINGACEFKSVRPEKNAIWHVAAVCLVEGSSWSANIRLAVTATELKWSSEKGEITYYRCGNSQ